MLGRLENAVEQMVYVGDISDFRTGTLRLECEGVPHLLGHPDGNLARPDALVDHRTR